MIVGIDKAGIGVVPDGWEIRCISDVADFVTSGSRGWAQFYSASGALFIRSQNIRGGRLDLNDLQYVNPPVGSEGNRTRVQLNDLLITITGNNVGNVGLVDSDFEEAYVSQHVGLVRFKDPKCSAFVCWYFSPNSPGNPQIFGSQSGQSKPGLNLQNIKDFRIAMPSLPSERQAIVTALSDIDALLSGLDRLIAKKRDLKQAAMQQLLTGKTRLPGFEGEWTTASLGDLCFLKSGLAITAERIDGHSPYRCFGGNGLRGYTKNYTHDGHYALIGRQGALCGNVLDVKGKFFASEHALVVTAHQNTSIAWLACVLGRMNLNQYSESSAQPGISAMKLLMLDIKTPPSLEEQAAIAAILADMDAELEALEARREKTRALKQGMMQELLTGRTRLV